MKRLDAALIPTTEALEHALYTRTWQRLFAAGEPFAPEHRELLARFGVPEVLLLEAADALEGLRADLPAEATKLMVLADATALHELAQPVYAASSALVARAGEPLTPRRKAVLLRHGLREVRVFRHPFAIDAFQRAKEEIADERRRRRIMRTRLSATRMLLSRESLHGAGLDALIARERAAPPAAGAPLEAVVKAVAPGSPRERALLAQFRAEYRACQHRVDLLFEALREGRHCDGGALQDLLNGLITLLVRDRALFLQLANLAGHHDPLVEHALRVTLLTINVAAGMGRPHEEVLELACGALLADIGLLRVPAELRAPPGPLTPVERAILADHPRRGLELLAALEPLPRGVPVVIAQAHERLDGSGFPRGVAADEMHRFARVVAVCDEYARLTAPRSGSPRRAGPEAIETLIELAQRGVLDPAVVKALVAFLSLYPPGTWLELDNGLSGPVIAANPGRGARPVMKVLYDGASSGPLRQAKVLNLATAPRRRVRSWQDRSERTEDVFIGF